MARPACAQEKGFSESITGSAFPDKTGSYCDVPGKSRSGYCRLNVNACISLLRLDNSEDNLSLNWAIPPRKGRNGPIRANLLTLLLTERVRLKAVRDSQPARVLHGGSDHNLPQEPRREHLDAHQNQQDSK